MLATKKQDSTSGTVVVRMPGLATFTPDTQDTLERYFARGGELVGPSNFGDMCERAMMFSHHSVPCPECLASGCSTLTPEELVERTNRLTEHRDESRRAMAAETDPQKRSELEERLHKQEKALLVLVMSEAACKNCAGTGRTPARKIARGHGDTVWTTVRCPTCSGCGETGRPDEWQLRRLVRELGDLPGADWLRADQIATTAKDLHEQGNTWVDVAQAMRLIACSGTAGAVDIANGADFAPGTGFDADAILRALSRVMVDECMRCEGNGHITPIDVRETGSSVPHGAEGPDPVKVAAHGAIDNIMDRVRAAEPTLAAVLEAYHGPSGNRWGMMAEGRVFAVWPLTKPGKLLASEAGARFVREHGGTRLDDCEVLARELHDDRTSSLENPRRRMMLDSADKSARTLVSRARAAWSAAVIASGHKAADDGRVYCEGAIIEAIEMDRADGNGFVGTSATGYGIKTAAKNFRSDYDIAAEYVD